MNRISPPESSDRRQGGAIFLFAVGVIVVLAAIAGINQVSSMTSSNRDTTAALELTHKATLLAESSVEEGVYGALVFDLDNHGNPPSDGLYMGLRSYLPPADLNQLPTPQSPVFDGATPMIIQAKYFPQLSYTAIANDQELRFSASDAASNPVYYGPLTWGPLVSIQNGSPLVLMQESNESVGVMGFANTVYARGRTGLFRDVDQSVQFSRPYKSLLMGTPWPYYKHSLFVSNCAGENADSIKDQMTLVDPITNPTHSLFAAKGPVKSGIASFYRKCLWQATMVKYYTEAMTKAGQTPSAIPTAAIDLDLYRPIVFDNADAGVVLDSLDNNNTPEVAQLQQHLGVSGGAMEDVSVDQYLKALLTLAGGPNAAVDDLVTRLTNVGNDLKAIGAKLQQQVRNVSKQEFDKYYGPNAAANLTAFNNISPQAWMARATRVYNGPNDMKYVLSKDQSQYVLDGVYYFQGPGPYTLDKPYVGTGILVFEDRVTVSNFAPADTANPGHAVVVAIPAPGKTDAISIAIGSDVTADLVAPLGTVTAPGASPAIPTFTVNGSVTVRFLADCAQGATANYFDSGAPSPMLMKINRGAKADYEYAPPASPGAAYDKKYAKHMQVFFDPGFVKKLYWSKRDRH